MMSFFFYWTVNMSLCASIVLCVILLLRRIRCLPRRILRPMYIAVLFRLLCPLSLGSRFSLMSLIDRFCAQTISISFDYFVLYSTNFMKSASRYSPFTYRTDLINSIFTLGGWIWFLGAVLLLCVLMLAYVRTCLQTRTAQHLEKNVYLCDQVTSPAAHGIFRCRILLPETYDASALRLIVLHENTHIRCGDNLYRLLALIAACIHWFNPLSWVFVRCLSEDIEYSCDESVLSVCTDLDKKEYARVLLTCAQRQNSLFSAFGGAPLRARIGRILTFRSLSRLSMLAAGLFLALIAFTLITNSLYHVLPIR